MKWSGVRNWGTTRDDTLTVELEVEMGIKAGLTLRLRML
jgi:hypothetical protein